MYVLARAGAASSKTASAQDDSYNRKLYKFFALRKSMNDLYSAVKRYLDLSDLPTYKIGSLMGHSDAYFPELLYVLKRDHEVCLQTLTDMADFFETGFEDKKHVRPFVFYRDGVPIPWIKEDESNPFNYYKRVLGLKHRARINPPQTNTIKRRAKENNLEVHFLVTVDAQRPHISKPTLCKHVDRVDA